MNFQPRFKGFNHLILLGLLCAFAFGACKKEVIEDDTEPEIIRKSSGFIVTGTTSSGNSLVKYFDELPTGTVDLSEGKDFAEFWPTAIYNNSIYLTRTDKASGFAKMYVNEQGEIVEEKVIPTVDEGSFRIAVKDAETGVFQDRATPNLITIFNPSTLTIEGTIDMSAGIDPIDSLEQRYQRFVFRGDDVFAPIRANSGETFSGFYLHQANLTSRSYVGSTFIEAPFSGGVLTVNNFGQGMVDEMGNLYFQDGGAIGTGTFSRIYKIPAGSNQIDTSYVFEPVRLLNPGNIFYPTMNGFKLVGNGKAIARVNAETPQAAVDIVVNAGGVSNVIADQNLLNQVLNILFTAESAEWCELDLSSQTVTPIAGAPKLGANAGGGVTFELNGEIYFPIATVSEQAYYKYTPGSPSATKAFDVVGADLAGAYNIANNN